MHCNGEKNVEELLEIFPTIIRRLILFKLFLVLVVSQVEFKVSEIVSRLIPRILPCDHQPYHFSMLILLTH